MANEENNYVYDQEASYLEKVENVLDDYITKNNIKINNDYDDMCNLDNSYEDLLSRQWYLDRIGRKKEENEEYYTMQDQPFFAHLEFMDKNKNSETVYVGKKSLYDNGSPLVIDWRAKAAQAFYQKTSTSFVFDNKAYDLRLRRSILINKAKIENIETEYDIDELDSAVADNVFDPFLLNIIREKRQIYKLTDIIATIQNNQLDIIHRPLNEEFVVQGCAGSGKTMILLHRLSYLKYHNPDIPLKKIKVLTPNNYFDYFIKELSAELELNQIERISVENYYKEILTYKYRVLSKDKKITPDEYLDVNMLQVIYSYEFVKECINRSKKYFNNIKANFKCNNFEELNYDYPSLKKIYDENNPSKFFNRVSYYYDSVKKYYSEKEKEYNDAKKKYEQYSKELESINIQKEESFLISITEKKESLRKQIKEIDESRTLSFMNNINKLKRKKKLEKYLRNIDIIETSYKKKKDKIEQLKIKTNKYLEVVKEAISSRPSEDMVYALRRLSEIPLLSFEKYHLETISLYEKELLSKFKIVNDKNTMYRYQLFLKMISAYCYYGSVIESDKWINIDEAQDLSLGEYYILKLVMGDKSTFNLYGDVNQLICPYKGIKDWDILKELIKINLYSLNENFRNSLQIAEFCNETLDLSILPIGVEGENISFVDIKHAINKVLSMKKNNIDFRNVVICKKPELIGAMFNNPLDKLWISIGKVDFKKVSIVSVNQVKGLEFDAVVVVEDMMDKNEKYVSYTRALDYLYIVKSLGPVL